MEELRKFHNGCKFNLIERCVGKGQSVLDCGCGRGGDWPKWKRIGVALTAVDPDEASIQEAIKRANTHRLRNVCIHRGDIRNVQGVFDAICYNFSIHYIRDTFKESVEAIARKTRRGGLLFGIVPDFDNVCSFVSPDPLGNTVDIVDQDHIAVKLVDGPFYNGIVRTEPTMNRRILEEGLAQWFELVEWSPMCKTSGFISDIYSQFIFKRK